MTIFIHFIWFWRKNMIFKWLYFLKIDLIYQELMFYSSKINFYLSTSSYIFIKLVDYFKKDFILPRFNFNSTQIIFYLVSWSICFG